MNFFFSAGLEICFFFLDLGMDEGLCDALLTMMR